MPVVSLHVHLNLFISIAEGMKSYENLFRLLKHNYKENYRTHSKHSLIRGLAYHLYISWFTDIIISAIVEFNRSWHGVVIPLTLSLLRVRTFSV